MAGLEKSCSHEKGDARHGDELFERPRWRDGGALGRAVRARFLFVGQAEDREKSQACDSTDHSDVRYQVDTHGAILKYRTLAGAGRLSIDRVRR